MKRVFLLLVIAVITFLLFLLFRNPEVLNEIWLWIIGLVGAILKGGRRLIDYFKSFFDSDEDSEHQNASVPKAVADPTAQPIVSKSTSTINLTLLRYHDDGDTSIGLLYINHQFYCYTLEDTYNEVKIKGETRIPAGVYNVNFLKIDTPLTEKYRTRYDWFTYHLEVEKVPNYTGIYIHNGGDHNDTEGCILVSDSISAGENSFLTNSKNTYKKLYQYLEKELKSGKKVSMQIKDEGWFHEYAS